MWSTDGLPRRLIKWLFGEYTIPDSQVKTVESVDVKEIMKAENPLRKKEVVTRRKDLEMLSSHLKELLVSEEDESRKAKGYQ